MSSSGGLSHVYWIGGGSRAGKSTIARRIAAEQELQIYSTDASMSEHAKRSNAQDHSLLKRFLAMGMDERWVNRSPEQMLETFPWFRGVCFDMIIDDLHALPSDRPVVVEGFRLLPELVLPYLAPNHGVWLLPTPRFRRSLLEHSIGSEWEFLKKTSDPQKALGNLLERDRIFTDRLRHDAKRLGLPTMEIDVGMSEDDVLQLATAILD